MDRRDEKSAPQPVVQRLDERRTRLITRLLLNGGAGPSAPQRQRLIHG